jgi:hypothetical protein
MYLPSMEGKNHLASCRTEVVERFSNSRRYSYVALTVVITATCLATIS